MSGFKKIILPLKAGVNRVEFLPNASSGKFPNDSRELSFQLFQPQLQRVNEL